MTLVKHLEELRHRLIVCILSIAVFSIAAYYYSESIFRWLAKPAGGLVFIAPAEAFLARLKIAFFGGLFLSVPVILFEVWKFVVVGLTGREKKSLAWILPSSYVLFTLGAALALFAVFPTAMRFLLAYGSDELKPFLSVGAYLRFVSFLTFSFGLLFQLPLVLLFLGRLGIITSAGLAKQRRLAYLVSFVTAAFLTPGPDIFSQILLAVPTILLYEISLIAMRWPVKGLLRN
ncbi:MAG: twin-arginine translocase subunit TatC [Elusimicrobia bacterium]|nr:twin-arginine translocase subunit TatC [Elusimicrobiota bacterium]